jgi:hypothetical protein
MFKTHSDRDSFFSIATGDRMSVYRNMQRQQHTSNLQRDSSTTAIFCVNSLQLSMNDFEFQ